MTIFKAILRSLTVLIIASVVALGTSACGDGHQHGEGTHTHAEDEPDDHGDETHSHEAAGTTEPTQTVVDTTGGFFDEADEAESDDHGHSHEHDSLSHSH